MATFLTERLEGGALAIAAQGVPVISLRPRSKVPIHARWPELGMLDTGTVRLEWREHPDANVGVLGGPLAFDGEGLSIIDVDQPDGPGAYLELAGVPIQDKATVASPSGGWHQWCRGSTISWNPRPGLEVRSVGRQCAAPPSINGQGRYRWMWGRPPRADDLDWLPDWALKPPNDDSRAEAISARVTDADLAGLDDPVMRIPPYEYFRVLTGLVPDKDGYVCCPIHGEEIPSLKVYKTADKGWFCYGESCRRGGDVISLTAYLAGIDQPVRGRDFVALLHYLHRRLIG